MYEQSASFVSSTLVSELRGLFKNKTIGPREFDMCAEKRSGKWRRKKGDERGRNLAGEERLKEGDGEDKEGKWRRDVSVRMGSYRAKNIAVNIAARACVRHAQCPTHQHTRTHVVEARPKCFSGVTRNTRPTAVKLHGKTLTNYWPSGH